MLLSVGEAVVLLGLIAVAIALAVLGVKQDKEMRVRIARHKREHEWQMYCERKHAEYLRERATASKAVKKAKPIRKATGLFSDSKAQEMLA